MDHRPSSPPRRHPLVLGTIAAIVALAAATAAAAAAQALWGTDGGGDRADPELVLRLEESDQDAGDLVNRTAEGDMLPDRSFPRLGGGSASFADYRGRPLVVNVFASWCPPCVAEMPDFETVYQEVGDRVAFLGLNLRDPERDAAALVERTGVTYDIGRDPSGELFQALGGVTMPSTFLVDAEGRVVEVAGGRLSAGELRDKVAELLR